MQDLSRAVHSADGESGVYRLWDFDTDPSKMLHFLTETWIRMPPGKVAQKIRYDDFRAKRQLMGLIRSTQVNRCAGEYT
jgi:hypothetical protein